MTIRANSSALIHFAANLPAKPYCSSDLSRLTIRPADKARQYPYIQPNDPYNVRWLVFDVDKGEDSFYAFENGVAKPNLIVKNRENANCHYLYLLKTPVWTKGTGSKSAENYLTAVRQAMTLKIGADSRYSGLICKNPLNEEWHTVEMTSNLYDLDWLADFVDLAPTSLQKAQNQAYRRLEDAVINGRNDYLFTLLRYYAYERITKYRELKATIGESKAFAMWDNAIRHEADRINCEFPNGLGISEINSTAKSVSRWVWNRYYPGEQVQRGIMGFGETRHNFNFDVPMLTEEERKQRQRKSAELTNKHRKENTELKIRQAIERLEANGQKVTKAEVARITGLNRDTMLEYRHLFDVKKMPETVGIR